MMNVRNILLGIVVSILLTGGLLSVFAPEEQTVTIEDGIAVIQSLYNKHCAISEEAKMEYLKVKEKMTGFERSSVESLFVENRRTLDSCAFMIACAFPDSLGFDTRRRFLLGAIAEMKHSTLSLIRITTMLNPYAEEKKERTLKSDP